MFLDDSRKCVACPAGKYSDNEGASECANCAAGKFVDGEGSDEKEDCKPCSVGKYVHKTGSASENECINCTAGKYVDSLGSDEMEDCIDCPKGKYIDVTGSSNASDCIGCIAGKFIDVPGSAKASDCKDCPKGTFVEVPGSGAESDCIACAKGKYVDVTGSDNVSNCIDCAAGKYAQDKGSTNISDCSRCETGRYLNRPGGRYVDVEGSDDESKCIDCSAGKYVTRSGSVAESDCQECAAGKYVKATGSARKNDCIDCPKGRYVASEACPAGKKSSAGYEVCVPCTKGTICPIGTSEDDLGRAKATGKLRLVGIGIDSFWEKDKTKDIKKAIQQQFKSTHGIMLELKHIKLTNKTSAVRRLMSTEALFFEYDVSLPGMLTSAAAPPAITLSPSDVASLMQKGAFVAVEDCDDPKSIRFATISKVNKDGTFGVKYRKGTSGERVSLEHLKLRNPRDELHRVEFPYELPLFSLLNWCRVRSKWCWWQCSKENGASAELGSATQVAIRGSDMQLHSWDIAGAYEARVTKIKITLQFVQICLRLGSTYRFPLPPLTLEFFEWMRFVELPIDFGGLSVTLDCYRHVDYIDKVYMHTSVCLAVMLVLIDQKAFGQKILRVGERLFGPLWARLQGFNTTLEQDRRDATIRRNLLHPRASEKAINPAEPVAEDSQSQSTAADEPSNTKGSCRE
eukprot:g1880.t1